MFSGFSLCSICFHIERDRGGGLRAEQKKHLESWTAAMVGKTARVRGITRKAQLFPTPASQREKSGQLIRPTGPSSNTARERASHTRNRKEEKHDKKKARQGTRVCETTKRNGRICEPFHLMGSRHSYQSNAAANEAEDGTKPKKLHERQKKRSES